MNTQGKTVSALESKKKSLLSHIDQLEISVGRQVLQASAPMVEQQLSVDYAAAAGTKQQLLRNIAEIEDLVNKQKELETKARNLQTSLSSKEELINAKLLELGRILYKNRNDSLPEEFKIHFAEAERLESLEDGYNQKVKEIETSLETASFLQKLAMQFKLSSLRNSAMVQQRKKEQVFISGARTVVETGENALNGSNISSELESAFEACLEEYKELDDIKNQLLENAGEAEVTKQSLIQLEASEFSGKKRIAQINAEISQIEINQDELCRTAGRSYISRYCTKDGEKILECEGIGSEEIASIEKERTELVSINRRIDIMQLNTALSDADKKIASLEKSAEEIRDQIANLEENASVIAEQIAAAHAAREVIIGKRTQLETEEGASVKMLKDNEPEPENAEAPKKAGSKKISKKS
ncbi:MAG: hypothetical protein J5505_05905 [Spirochaetaceae bacterium]|nr:hypothetical protein [Spirochaetaceae bacterium]